VHTKKHIVYLTKNNTFLRIHTKEHFQKKYEVDEVEFTSQVLKKIMLAFVRNLKVCGSI